MPIMKAYAGKRSKSNLKYIKYTSKKRGYTKKKKQLRNRTSVAVGLGFPKRMVMTHKYHENLLGLSSNTGLLGTYVFKCNGMYDPNTTGTGHQPMYFDQMSAIYDHYTVIGARLIFKFVTTGNNNSPCKVGVFLNDDATVTPTSADALLEQSSAISYRQLPSASNNVYTITSKWSAKKTFGGSILGNDNLQGTASADPVEQSTFVLFIQSNDLSTTNTITGDVYIEYIAVWDELRDLASS